MSEAGQAPAIVRALGEEPIFSPGDSVRVAMRAAVRHYRVPLADLWPNYAGSAADGLRIEVFESWLERA